MLRGLSIATGFVAYIAPYLWMQSAMDEAYAGKVGPVCGMPAMAIVTLAAMGAAVISLVGFAFAVIAYRRALRPRGKLRLVEVLAVFLPFLVCAPFAAWVLFGA